MSESDSLIKSQIRSIIRKYYAWEGEAGDTMARMYESGSFDLEGLEHSRRMKLLLKLIRSAPKGLMLDIGCGEGYYLKGAQRIEFQLFGLDICFAKLRTARKVLHDRGALLFQSEAENPPIRDNIVDLVLCSEVLEHLIDPQEALIKIHGMLKKDGVAIISIPIWHSEEKEMVSSEKEDLHEQQIQLLIERQFDRPFEGHLWRFSSVGFSQIIKRCNLEIIQEYTIALFAPIYWRRFLKVLSLPIVQFLAQVCIEPIAFMFKGKKHFGRYAVFIIRRK